MIGIGFCLALFTRKCDLRPRRNPEQGKGFTALLPGQARCFHNPGLRTTISHGKLPSSFRKDPECVEEAEQFIQCLGRHFGGPTAEEDEGVGLLTILGNERLNHRRVELVEHDIQTFSAPDWFFHMELHEFFLPVSQRSRSCKANAQYRYNQHSQQFSVHHNLPF